MLVAGTTPTFFLECCHWNKGTVPWKQTEIEDGIEKVSWGGLSGDTPVRKRRRRQELCRGSRPLMKMELKPQPILRVALGSSRK